MLHGPDGKSITKMTWDQFTQYQRWEEFPERPDNPPMTVDFAFWLHDQKYFCTGEDGGFVLVDDNWNRIAYNKNFLRLLDQPVFDGQSFHNCINDILFID